MAYEIKTPLAEIKFTPFEKTTKIKIELKGKEIAIPYSEFKRVWELINSDYLCDRN